VSNHDAETEVRDERIKIPIVVQQIVPALDTFGGNHRVDRLADGHAAVTQRPKIPCGLYRDFLSAQLHYRQCGQYLRS
jgi:hypothetical protein